MFWPPVNKHIWKKEGLRNVSGTEIKRLNTGDKTVLHMHAHECSHQSIDGYMHGVIDTDQRSHTGSSPPPGPLPRPLTHFWAPASNTGPSSAEPLTLNCSSPLKPRPNLQTALGICEEQQKRPPPPQILSSVSNAWPPWANHLKSGLTLFVTFKHQGGQFSFSTGWRSGLNPAGLIKG